MSESKTKNDSINTLPEGEYLPLPVFSDLDQIRFLVAEHLSGTGISAGDCRIEHLRYTPFWSAKICYSLELVDDSSGKKRESVFYARCCSPKRYEEIKIQIAARKWINGGPVGSIVEFPQWNTLLFSFPNDLLIKGLHLLGQNRFLGRDISAMQNSSVRDDLMSVKPDSLRRLKYKPEDRCILSGNIGDDSEVILRFDRHTDGSHYFDLSQRLNLFFDHNPLVGIPRPLTYDAEAPFTITAAINGIKLSKVLSDQNAEQVLISAMQGLALLHRYDDPLLTLAHPNDLLNRASRLVQFLRPAIPDKANMLEKIYEQLLALTRTTKPETFGLVHGDFHQGQIIHDNGRNWFLDFERSYFGETVADLGNWAAQMRLLKIRRGIPSDSNWESIGIEAYQDAAGCRLNSDRLRLWTVIGLLELAAKQLRGLKRSWPKRVEMILQVCCSELDSSGQP